MNILKACLASLVFALGVVAKRNDDSTNNPNFKHNLGVIPVVEASTDRAYELHRYIYSLFWLKRRIAFGDEKHFVQIPQISFYMEPHYYEAKVTSLWIDLKPGNLKSVNITISVPKITAQIQQLENEALQRRVQQKNVGEGVNIEHEEEEVKANFVRAETPRGRRVDQKNPDHHIHHYYYYLQAEYHCVIPPGDPSIKCQNQHYLLDAIYIQIYPVTHLGN